MADDTDAALKQLTELTATVEALQKLQEGILAKNSQLIAENNALKKGEPHKPAGKEAAAKTLRGHRARSQRLG